MTAYTWRSAQLHDVDNILALAKTHFEVEIDSIFTPEVPVYIRNITFAIVNQHFNPFAECLYVAYDGSQLLAYTWAKSNEVAAWSDDRMVSVRMAHVDLNLSTRLRVKLITDMMKIWENLARLSRAPVVCSTTMRHDQDAFLKLHQRNGYDVRGSYAYKRLVQRSVEHPDHLSQS